jgi:hypothetical protein
MSGDRFTVNQAKKDKAIPLAIFCAIFLAAHNEPQVRTSHLGYLFRYL